jgi:predicted DNA-binding protein (UPF0251 family)
MSTQANLTYCRACQNRKFDPQQGLVCNLTQKKPEFVDTCPSFAIDEPEAIRLRDQERMAVQEETSGGFSAEQKGLRKGVLGGVLMMVIAAVWFIGGLAADRIFFYPPVLFIIGLVGLVKGIIEGNINGEKYRQ